MTVAERALIALRLRNQRLAASSRATLEAIVAHFGAVQAQDYSGAAWALAQRLTGIDEASVEQALASGAIVRTHILRPTWHFVAASDLRWMLALSGPRVSAVCAGRFQKLGVDGRIASRSRAILERALSQRGPLTRSELGVELAGGGVAVDTLQLAHVMMQAELNAVICSGPRRGRQFTYALVDERVPAADARSRDEALAALAIRYFRSHGPAALADYVWWSGLTTADARRGIAAAGRALGEWNIGGRTCWVSNSGPATARAASPSVHLLPNYDEYVVAYRDRSPIVSGARAANIVVRGIDPFAHHLLVDGRVAGSWKRTDRAQSVGVSVTPYVRLGARHVALLESAVARLGRFLRKPAALDLTAPRKPAS